MLGVPTLYRMILENDRLKTYDLSSLKYCYCGGDVLPREVLKRWTEIVGEPIYQVYGSTEAGHVTYSRPDMGEPPPMSIGLPLPSRRCLVVDPETLEPVAFDQPGELVVTSEHTVKSYWNKPEETKRAFILIREETFYRTNDYVTMAEDGLITYVERSADILKHKGYRVSASEIEAVLQDHEAVIGACVVGGAGRKSGGAGQGHRGHAGGRQGGRGNRPDPVLPGAAGLLQDPFLHRVPGYAAQVQGGQTAPPGDPGRGTPPPGTGLKSPDRGGSGPPNGFRAVLKRA